MTWRILLVVFSLPLIGATLADLKSTAAKLQAQRPKPPGWRGESPLLTELKHEMRDWIESNMTGQIADPAALAGALNRALKDAGLMCQGGLCGADNNLGHVGKIEITASKGNPAWLILVTSVGIVCEADQSIYLYESHNGKWNRRLMSEQNGYGKSQYRPQWVNGELSLSDPAGVRLFLTVGFNPACMSVWQQGYIRLFKVGAQITEVLNWEESMFNIGEEVDKRVEPHEALIEFGSRNLEPGYARRRVLHFAIEGNRAKRVQPVALQPSDFVDEWLTNKWSDAVEWSDPKLDRVHARLSDVSAEGFEFAQKCQEKPGVTQVAASFEKLGVFYFLVEDRRDHQYRMLDVNSRRQSGCPGEQPVDMLKQPSLFPHTKAR